MSHRGLESITELASNKLELLLFVEKSKGPYVLQYSSHVSFAQHYSAKLNLQSRLKKKVCRGEKKKLIKKERNAKMGNETKSR